jgi:ABC-type transporter Mla maintaining outer membrane lipid asymmetry ATPase subunit MlaF
MSAAPETTPAASTAALEMIDVTVTSLLDQKRVVLENVNWTVREREYWAVGGLHGSGKSDFISAAAGILPPVRGKFRLFGKDILPGFELDLLPTRLKVGLVFDGGRLLNHLTVAENVALPLQYHSDLPLEDMVERVRRLLEFAHLLPSAERYSASLSRSNQQRAGLARALALKPSMLLLDTPLTGLDPREAIWWIERLDHLAAGDPIVDGQPITLIVSADDLRPWRGHAKQFAVLRNKRLSEVASAADQGLTDETLMHEMGGNKD